MLNHTNYIQKMKEPNTKNFTSFKFYHYTNPIGTAFTEKDAVDRGFAIFNRSIAPFVENSKDKRFEANGYHVIKEIDTDAYDKYVLEYAQEEIKLLHEFKNDLITTYKVKDSKKLRNIIDIAIKHSNNNLKKAEEIFADLIQLI